MIGTNKGEVVKKIGFSIVLAINILGAEEVDLGVVDVVGKGESHNTQIGEYSSSRTIDRSKLETITSKNHDISEVLKTNPSVSFNPKSNTATQEGEISPQDVSISGAKFYQNNYLIDGVSFNNDINPDGYRTLYKNIWHGPIMGSQSINLDTDLLDSIEVLDSSVSAKYGGFQGGVVNAKTRDPKKDFHGTLSYGYSSGDWSESFIDPYVKNNYANSMGWEDKSDFVKQRYRYSMEGYVTDTFGLLFDYTKSQSNIDMKTKTTLMDSSVATFPDQKRTAENYFLKGIWRPTDRLVIKPSLLYSKQINNAFLEGTFGSDMDVKLGGYVATVEAAIDLDSVLLEQSLSFSKYDSSRYFDNDSLYAYKISNIKNWGVGSKSAYGGLGDLEEIQNNISYKLDISPKTFEAFGVAHNVKTGVEFLHQDGTYKIVSPYTYYVTPTALPSGYICASSDMTCVNDNSFSGLGQYFGQKYVYSGVDNKTNMDKISYYIEDEMKYERFKIRPGIRIERDSITDDVNIAPRFVTEYDLLSDDANFIGFGLNRYYGRNLFAYKIYSDMYSHYNTYTRTSPDAVWVRTDGWINDQANKDFKTPYDDELSLFYHGDINNARLNLKYVKRNSQNEIVRISRANSGTDAISGLDSTYLYYANDGKSKTDIVTFSIQNIDPLMLNGLKNYLEFALTYTDKKSNFGTYWDSDISTNVIYNGRVISYSELPVVDFYTPFTAKISHTMETPFINTTFSNFVNFIGKTDALISGWDSVNHMDTYDRVKLDSYATWDMRIAYKQPLSQGVQFFANLDINNILNDKHAINGNSYNHTVYYDYATGRNVWLEVGFNW